MHLGKGIASYLLDYILTEARRRKYLRVSLETGSFDAFTPALNLYTKMVAQTQNPTAWS